MSENTLTYSTDLIDFDNINLKLKVAKAKPVGTYQIKVIGILPDLFSTISTVITIIIRQNHPPRTTTSITTPVYLSFGQDYIYTLPQSADPENKPYTTSILTGPPFISMIQPANLTLRMHPTNCWTDIGHNTVEIKLEDQEPRSNVYSIEVYVENKPPNFIGILPQN